MLPTRGCCPICCMGKKPGYGATGVSRANRVIQECAPGRRITPTVAIAIRTGLDEVERAKNRTKSRVRSKVEHVFRVMKLKFGFVKVRYRGLKKNATGCSLPVRW